MNADLFGVIDHPKSKLEPKSKPIRNPNRIRGKVTHLINQVKYKFELRETGLTLKFKRQKRTISMETLKDFVIKQERFL